MAIGFALGGSRLRLFHSLPGRASWKPPISLPRRLFRLRYGLRRTSAAAGCRNTISRQPAGRAKTKAHSCMFSWETRLQQSLDCLKRRALNLDVAAERKLVDSNTSPTLIHPRLSARLSLQATECVLSYWLRLPDKELVVDFVHGGKVAHVGQKDIHLDHVLETAPRGLEDRREVLECLALATG